MKIVREKISLDEIKYMANNMFGNMVKAVVDVERKIMAVDGELHSDEEEMLLKDGSKQQNLWGINIYPEESEDKFIEYDSMINLRPSQGNKSRYVENSEIREKIKEIVFLLIEK